MKNVRFLVVSLALLLCLFLVYGCGDDEPTTGPFASISSELVGTWYFYSVTYDGVPQIFPDISNTDTSQTGTITFNSGNTYSVAEYYNAATVYTQSGTCYTTGSRLAVIMTMEQGAAVNPPDTSYTSWDVSGAYLTLTDTVYFDGPMVVIQTYVKD